MSPVIRMVWMVSIGMYRLVVIMINIHILMYRDVVPDSYIFMYGDRRPVCCCILIIIMLVIIMITITAFVDRLAVFWLPLLWCRAIDFRRRRRVVHSQCRPAKIL